MARRRGLTDRQIAALPRKAKRYAISDPEQRSLFLRVPPQGPINYTIIVKRHGKQTWASIGTTDDFGIDEARERARQAIKRVKVGQKAVDPPPKPPQSVAVAAQSWLTRHVDKNKLRSAQEVRRIVGTYIVPHVGDADFVALRRSDIVAFLDVIEDKHGAATADAVLATLRSIASWVQKRSDDYVPPFARGMRRVPKQQHQRSRVLSDDELQTVWRAAENAGRLGAIIRLLLLTCQRCAKVYRMRWTDISPDGVWTIPTEPREKGNAGRLRLPPAALGIIRSQPHFASSAFVFPQVPTNRTAQAFKKRCGVDFRLHDLRRTSRTLLSRIGIAHNVAESVLGHALPGVSAVYDRHSFEPEKGIALERLATTIQQIVYPTDNVVALHGAVS
jgi:integrase